MASLYDRISKGTMSVDEITASMVRATSEGGKFFQSMEKQSQTLSGQLSTLKDNAEQLLGSLTEGLSDELRDDLLPFVNGMIGELQTAFAQGGTQGLIDAATKMIPDLLNMMSGEFESGLAAIGKWLPKGASALMKFVPQAISGASNIIPQITTALFEVATAVITDLTAMLPELVPAFAEGIFNAFGAALNGTVNLLDGLFTGAERALKKIGVLAPTAAEAFASIVEGVEQQDIDALKKTVDVNIETDITVDDYQTEIDTAVDAIETALKNVPGLSEAEREIIKNAIIKGSGIDVVQLAFDEMGIDSTAATNAITAAQTNINTVVEGLGLSETAEAHIQGLITNNADAADIQAALESFGVPEGVAASAAASITGVMDGLSSTLTDLGVPANVIAKLRGGILNDKQMIVTSLKWLGLEDSDLKTVTASYDTVAGTITAGIDGIYQDIADTFTDGIPETDADVQAAKTAIEGVATEAQTRLDKWYSDKVVELKKSGLTGETLDAALLETKTIYDELSGSLEETTNTALTQTESMVGKSTAYCQEQVGIMQDTFGLLKDITAEIDMLTDKDVSAAETSRKLTVAGVTSDTGTQLEAFLVTYKEYTDKVRRAEEEYLAETEKAREAYEAGGSEKDYQAAETEARLRLNEAKQHAANYYQQYVDSIIGGIMMADPEMSGIIQQAVGATSIGKLATDLNAALISAFDSNQRGETTLTLEDVLGKFNIDETGVANLAETLGITPEALMNQLNAALKTGDTTFGTTTSGFVTGINDTLSDLLSGENVDLTGVAATLATAIESGYLLPGINGVDYTNAETIWNTALANALEISDTVLSEASAAGETLVTAAEEGGSGSSSAGLGLGGDFGSGYVSAIRSWAKAAYSAGYTLGKSATRGTADAQDSASPSKVAMGLGGDFGEGYTIGLQQSMARAAQVARQLTGSIATSADITQTMRVANMPNLQQEIAFANEQNKTPVYLNGVQIAEIQGHNNSMQLAWQNTRAAKGVGSR